MSVPVGAEADAKPYADLDLRLVGFWLRLRFGGGRALRDAKCRYTRSGRASSGICHLHVDALFGNHQFVTGVRPNSAL